MIAKNFKIQELVPQRIFDLRGQLAWELIDPRLIIVLDRLRDRYGPMIINTWHSSRLIEAYGFRDQSGLRTREFYSSEADFVMSLSQHKYGRAADILFRDHTAEEVRIGVMKNISKYPEIGGIEYGVPWFHFDVRNSNELRRFTNVSK